MSADADKTPPANLPATREVMLHIERLVMDGVALDGGQIAQLRAALQGELTRLLQRDGGAALQGGAAPLLQAPVVRISAPFQPADLGRQIARSVHASLSKPL